MNTQQLDRYRQQLEKMADRVGETAAALEEGVRVPLGGEAGGGVSNAPMHLGDLGTHTFSQELDSTLLENETYLRDEALAALGRIDDGTFGRCVSCQKDIGTARLDALPYVRQCVKCAQSEQSGLAVNVNDGRPAGWLGGPGHEATAAPQRVVGRDLGADRDDIHAAGTPGGGTSMGGLAGTNAGSGAPDQAANLQDAMGSGTFDDDEDEDEDELPADAGSSGGAVGGTPANKRATGAARKGRAVKPSTRAKKSKE